MYKLGLSAQELDDFCIVFDRDRKRRQRELSNIENKEGKYHVRFMLRDKFFYALHHEKAIYGLI